MSTSTKKLFTFQELLGGSLPKEAIFYAIAAYKKENFISYLHEKNQALEEFKMESKEFFFEQGVTVKGIVFDYSTGFQLILKGVTFSFPHSKILEDSFGAEYTAQLGEMYNQEFIEFELFKHHNSPFIARMTENFDSYFNSLEERNQFLEVFDKYFQILNVKLHRMMEYAVKKYFDFSSYFDSEDYQYELYLKDPNRFNHLRFTDTLEVVI